MKASLFSIVTMFLTLFSCVKDKYADDDFILNKTEYFGNELKTDGYYYALVEGETYYRLYIFYRNGVILIPGVSDNPDHYLLGFSESSGIYTSKDSWGLFQIETENISLEYYKPGMIEGRNAYLKTGNIINDTTFVINKIARSKDGSEHRIVNETYHYKHFDPKPDSTNRFF